MDDTRGEDAMQGTDCPVRAQDVLDIVQVLPSQAVRDHTAPILQGHPLRAADALQLAAALVWVQGHPIGQPFVCLDHRLRAAAQREGFLLVPSPESLQAPTPPQCF
ncbi:MAG TPA: hypothetical protein VI542_21185 [Candidatus Tectomicrobia bacterium]